MIEIGPGDGRSPEPYLHLLPIVEALVAAGNQTLHERGFHPTQGGWVCEMRDPIDFALLRHTFVLHKTIIPIPESDQIFDSGTWTAIDGPRSVRMSDL